MPRSLACARPRYMARRRGPPSLARRDASLARPSSLRHRRRLHGRRSMCIPVALLPCVQVQRQSGSSCTRYILFTPLSSLSVYFHGSCQLPPMPMVVVVSPPIMLLGGVFFSWFLEIGSREIGEMIGLIFFTGFLKNTVEFFFCFFSWILEKHCVGAAMQHCHDSWS